MMGLGICVVGVGLMLGIANNDQKIELIYLVAGLLFFSAGRLILPKQS